MSNCQSFCCCSLSSEFTPDVYILPYSPVVEIGKSFTATCSLANTSEATADDIVWRSSLKIIPREQYTKINTSAVNVTIMITSETQSWLFCKVNKANNTKDSYGIELQKGCKFPRMCLYKNLYLTSEFHSSCLCLLFSD